MESASACRYKLGTETYTSLFRWSCCSSWDAVAELLWQQLDWIMCGEGRPASSTDAQEKQGTGWCMSGSRGRDSRLHDLLQLFVARVLLGDQFFAASSRLRLHGLYPCGASINFVIQVQCLLSSRLNESIGRHMTADCTL